MLDLVGLTQSEESALELSDKPIPDIAAEESPSKNL